MFTGIVECLGTIETIERRGGDARVRVRARWPDDDHPGVQLGDSVAINGTCLTVVAFDGCADGVLLDFDASHETLRLTSLGDLSTGSMCNLERALRLSDRLGGHLVSGHVDATGTLMSVRRAGDCQDLTYRMPAELAPEVARKGSIAIDGVSLTVNAVTAATFSVTVIPHTVQRTQLLTGGAGKRVNLETDLIAKYVRRLLGAGGCGSITAQLLETSGFIE